MNKTLGIMSFGFKPYLDGAIVNAQSFESMC